METKQITVKWVTTIQTKIRIDIIWKQPYVEGSGPAFPATIYDLLELYGQAVGSPTTPLPTFGITTLEGSEFLPVTHIREFYPVERFRQISDTPLYREYDYPPSYNPLPGAVPNIHEYWRRFRPLDELHYEDFENTFDFPETDPIPILYTPIWYLYEDYWYCQSLMESNLYAPRIVTYEYDVVPYGGMVNIIGRKFLRSSALPFL